MTEIEHPKSVRKPLRVLVCGGRHYADKNAMWRALDELAEVGPEVEAWLGKRRLIVITGGATGADQLADDWAVVNWHGFENYPADWRTHGRAAGPIRNQRMIDEGKPDLVLAFPGGDGTADMIRRSEAAGIEVRRCG